MRESPYPLEKSLGMRCYASDTPGIGGRLRERAEDFAVDEVFSSPGTEGPYLVCRLTKKNWEMQRAAREIARQLGISHRRVSWTGTKDTHALTTQLIAIYGVSEEDLERVTLRDIGIAPAGRSQHPLTLGGHAGNRFTITIRDTCSPDPERELAEVAETCRRGIPNYFGIQRFGVVRPVTHLVGLHILRGGHRGCSRLLHRQGVPRRTSRRPRGTHGVLLFPRPCRRPAVVSRDPLLREGHAPPPGVAPW